MNLNEKCKSKSRLYSLINLTLNIVTLFKEITFLNKDKNNFTKCYSIEIEITEMGDICLVS